MQKIANHAVKLTDGAVAVLSEDAAGFGYIIASEKLPLRAMAKDINLALGGKGGGSDQMIQGTFTAPKEAIESYFKAMQM